MVCFCKDEVGKIFKLNLVLNCKLNTRKSSKVSTTPHQSYTTSSNTGGWLATELTYVQPHTTLTSEKINKSGTAVMSQTEYYFQIPNFGLFTGYMTKYSAYATMLKLKMSRTEYYYGATRGQITLLCVMNLVHNGVNIRREDSRTATAD